MLHSPSSVALVMAEVLRFNDRADSEHYPLGGDLFCHRVHRGVSIDSKIEKSLNWQRGKEGHAG